MKLPQKVLFISSDIEGTAHTFAEEVEGDHRKEECRSGEKGEVPMVKRVVECLTEQSAPAGGGGLDTESEKTQSAFSKDRSGNTEGEADENGSCDIGQQMTEHDLADRNS